MNSSKTSRSGGFAWNILITMLLVLAVYSFVFDKTMEFRTACLFEVTIVLMLLFYSASLKVYNYLFVLQACASLAVVAKILANLISSPIGENTSLNPTIFAVILFCLSIYHVNNSSRKQPAADSRQETGTGQLPAVS